MRNSLIRSFASLSLAAAVLLLFHPAPLSAQVAVPRQAHSFTVQGDHFALDGKPFQIISGSIHYARIPRKYWRDRLKKAKAMGLNTVETYVFWNVHEPRPGVYDFSGRNDVAEFVREAQQEGLYVILRPGPYACAEWDFGGYPSWLLKDPNMVVRSSYPGFISAATRWLNRLGQELAPLQIGNGGPIIAVQVENEYGSYGDDHAYMEQIHHILLNSGFTKSLLYTADGADMLAKGSLPELTAAINFGPGGAQRSFALLKKFRPGGPSFNSEFYVGWFDHWGDKHNTGDVQKQLSDFRWMLAQGYSVNLYMFDGGTSFGWMNGANSDGTNYQPDVTSYDYDAPVREDGSLRPKYYQFRTIIEQATRKTPPQPPAATQPITIAPIPLTQSASLWNNLPRPVHSTHPLTMEDLGQSYGYILYRTNISGPKDGVLTLDRVHDYAQVYLDGKLAGTIDRRLGQTGLPLHVTASKARLDILVENTGRVNYGPAITGERAGITHQVLFAGAPLKGWDIFPLPMDRLKKMRFTNASCTGACFYRATFHVQAPGDTFLDMRSLNKGEVWINWQPLGRFWNVGPQHTLYLPGPWLKTGENAIVVFDLNGSSGKTIAGIDKPILDGPVITENATAEIK